ncbi:MAG: hypothetical protein ACXABY_18615, partial [Candidatus Thorarchaeota archaeon]
MGIPIKPPPWQATPWNTQRRWKWVWDRATAVIPIWDSTSATSSTGPNDISLNRHKVLARSGGTDLPAAQESVGWSVVSSDNANALTILDADTRFRYLAANKWTSILITKFTLSGRVLFGKSLGTDPGNQVTCNINVSGQVSIRGDLVGGTNDFQSLPNANLLSDVWYIFILRNDQTNVFLDIWNFETGSYNGQVSEAVVSDTSNLTASLTWHGQDNTVELGPLGNIGIV